jgi:hypothetical protein
MSNGSRKSMFWMNQIPEAFYNDIEDIDERPH